MVNYYVYRFNGEVRRLAKIEDNTNAFAYINGKWEPMQALIKIVFDITDYDEITEAEANEIMKELDA